MKRLFFSTFLLFMALGANAQEFVKIINDSSAEHHVRRVSNTEWLYSVRHARNGQKTQTLTLMDATGTSFPSVTLDDVNYIYDMEVADNKAFFIGESPSVGSPLFGFIPLGTFPGGTVSYFPLDVTPDCLMPVPAQFDFKVYMSAHSPNLGYGFLEAYNNTPSPTWNFNINLFNDTEYKVDDIAVTTNYVVFTVRDVTNNDGYFFKQPRAVNPFAEATRVQAQLYKVTSSAYSRLLVEAGTGDTVYIVHSNRSDCKTIAVHKYDTDGHCVASRQLDGPFLRYNSMVAIDLTYDNQYKVLSILSQFMVASSFKDVIWHIGNGQMVSGGPVYGHTYQEMIESFDHLQDTARNIIAAGIIFYDYNNSSIYRLKDDNAVGSCLSMVVSGFSPYSGGALGPVISWDCIPIYYPKETLSKTTGVTGVTTICPQQ